MKKYAACFLPVIFVCTTIAHAQDIHLTNPGDIKKNKPLTVNGGINANGIYFNGNSSAVREPYTYNMMGTLNFNIAGVVNLPFSFNLSNVGSGLNYPTMPTRISLNPVYKSIQAHIGDVSMQFSPYTLNGILFRGAGFDYVPKGKLRFSAMGGRLQQAVEYDSTNRVTEASYQRFGYGAKVDYVEKSFRLGVIVFAAKDRVNSLQLQPDSVNIFPQQNLVVSWRGAIMPAKDMELSAEYSTSALTRDLRDTTTVQNETKQLLRNIIDTRNSTSFYNALKVNLNQKFKNAIIGIGYEKIDPGYQTLGAYFFNNDMENITLNYSQPFAKSKGTVAANFGYQRDNLDGSKVGSNKRLIGAVNFSYTPSQKFYATAGYSNFQTYMNIRPLFQTLNPFTQFQNIDTLNFSQVSQNATLNLNFMMEQNEKRSRSLLLNFNFVDARDRQSGSLQPGNKSQFYMGSASYVVAWIPKEMNLSTSFTVTQNNIANSDFLTIGPTVSFTSRWFKRVLTSAVASYNRSTSSTNDISSILNSRLTFTYKFKNKQNFNLSVINQFINASNRANTSDLMVTAGYGWFF